MKKNKTDYRIIHAPNQELKKVQRKILDLIVSKTPLPHYVYGQGPSKSIVDNAMAHSKNDFLLNVDIKNFFPSVNYKKIQQLFSELGLSKEQSLLFTRLTTLDKCLPQGAPTSPYLASLVLNSLDNRIYSLCKKNRLTYTRYFDDISISGSERVFEVLETVSKIVKTEGFELHDTGEKIQRYTPVDTKIITGILISPSGHLSVSGIDELDKYIITLSSNGLKNLETDNILKEKQMLYGKVAFIRQVNLSFGMKLKILLDSIEWGV